MNAFVILGPTAVGKSLLAVELAKNMAGEIISADSMQVYRGMDIGTAKPTDAERQGIPHHLIDIRNPDEPWTVSDFVAQTKQLVAAINQPAKVPLIVGGTGLYLRALLEGFSFPLSPADWDLRARLEQEDLPALYSRLSAVDPKAAEKIHPHDQKRIIRALEVYEQTGVPISARQNVAPDSNFTLIGVDLPRPILYSRINARVDSMLEKGLVAEVQNLLARGYNKALPSFQALGYKEVINYLEGSWTYEKMVAELKKRTRHFARRQMTWFKRFSDVHWFLADAEPEALLTSVLSFIRQAI